MAFANDREYIVMNGEHKIKRKPEKQGLLKDYSVILGAMVVILAGIHSARGVLGPLFLATFFAALLNTPVNWLKARGFKQWLALTIVIIGVAVVGLSSMTIIGTQIAQFARNIPEYRDRFNETLEGYNLDAGDLFPFLKSDGEKEKEKPTEEEEAKEAYLNELRWRDKYERAKNGADDVVKKSKSDPEQKSQNKEETPQGNPHELERAGLHAATITPVSLTTVELFPDTAIQSSELSQNEAEAPQRLVSRDPQPTSAAQELAPNDNKGLIPSDPPTFRSHDDEVVKDVENALAETFNVDGANEGGASEKSADEDEASHGALEADTWRLLSQPQEAVSAVGASSQELFRFLRGLAGELSYFGSNAFLITLLVIFMLCETAKIPRKLVAALGRKRFTNSHIESVIDDIRSYMVIKTMMSCLVGVLVAVLCIVTQVQYAVLWGFVAFLLNYIPNIGSVAAAIPPIVLATIDRGLFIGCVDAAFLVLINCLVGYALEPRLLGDGLDLSPLIVLISLIFFGWLLGPVGMFLSPPLAVIMKIIFQAFPETRWIAALMANKPPKDVVEDDSEEVSSEA